MRTLIHNVMIFDGTPQPPRPGAVLIDEDSIAQVFGGGADFADNAVDHRIDGGGATLMPGMVEGHAHLTWGSSVEKIYHQFELPHEELKVAAWRNARVLLDSGFTSAYSAGALGDGIETELAAAIEAGETPGPRLIPSTIERSPEGDDTGNIFNGKGPDAMRGFVAHCADTGVKVVKLMISGEDALKPDTHNLIYYTEAEMAAAEEATRAAGLLLSAHVYSSEAIELALRHGVRVLYHCSYADAGAIHAMVAAKDGIFYAPAVGVLVATLEANPPPHINMSQMKSSAQEALPLLNALVPTLKNHGVRIVIGGDYGFPFNPNGTNARDLIHFVKHFGYTPAEALSAATLNGGALMDMKLGQVREGFLADLLLIDGDPTQDINIMMDRGKIRMIMKGGALHKGAELAQA